jgi:hypothetical protein
MRVKRLLWSAAWGCMLVWAVRGALLFLEARNIAQRRTAIPWLGDDSPVGLTLSVITAALMLAAWIASIYAWARSSRRGFVHGLALMMLIFTGMFTGPFYILAAVHTIPTIEPNQAAA